MAAAEPLTAADSVFTVQGHSAVLRVLTQAATCPQVQWEGQGAHTMALRVAPATIAQRAGGEQKHAKEAAFEVRVCEAAWPAGVTGASVAGRRVAAPKAEIRRIVIVADTGCRMKASEKAFQSCNDATQWPFAQVARAAAALKPDLVLHIGDIHYRESPCPVDNAGCAASPWGYGYDAWQADLFTPARPLLEAAPWVFVRGNHESCFRAGQGWFRFIDAQPWSEARSCNAPSLDGDADYSEPYAVAVTAQSQFIVFDSSKANGKPYGETDPAYAIYARQLASVAQLAQSPKDSFFLSHHPLLAVAQTKKSGKLKLAGNEGLQSVFSVQYPQRLFPQGVAVALHGHVHLFESMSFKGEHPASLVLGNSGSANEGAAPEAIATGTELYPGVEVEDYASRSEFGFATLDRVDGAAPGQWLLTEYAVNGVPVLECSISGGKSRCRKRVE